MPWLQSTSPTISVPFSLWFAPRCTKLPSTTPTQTVQPHATSTLSSQLADQQYDQTRPQTRGTMRQGITMATCPCTPLHLKDVAPPLGFASLWHRFSGEARGSQCPSGLAKPEGYTRAKMQFKGVVYLVRLMRYMHQHPIAQPSNPARLTRITQPKRHTGHQQLHQPCSNTPSSNCNGQGCKAQQKSRAWAGLCLHHDSEIESERGTCHMSPRHSAPNARTVRERQSSSPGVTRGHHHVPIAHPDACAPQRLAPAHVQEHTCAEHVLPQL
jgi:hypothetical protein